MAHPPGEAPQPARALGSAGRRRGLRLAVVVALIVALAAGLAAGWLARGWRSAAAPEPVQVTAPITMPVRQGTLDGGLLVQAEFTYPNVGTLTGQGVVTRAPAAGAVVKEGDTPFEFDLLPQLVLQGERPMVRTLKLGTTGVDVAQLNAALARLGESVSAKSDTITEQTLTAWARLTAQGRAAAGLPATVTQIEVSEVAFAPALPARVGEVKVPVGTAASGAVAELTQPSPQVFVTVGTDAAALLPATPTVEVISPVDQSRTAMKVTGRTVKDDGSVVLKVAGSLPEQWQGSPLRARVSSASQDAEGLLVPRAALSLISNGSAQVRVWNQGETTTVTVAVLAFDRADARVSGDLKAGDQVVIAQ